MAPKPSPDDCTTCLALEMAIEELAKENSRLHKQLDLIHYKLEETIPDARYLSLMGALGLLQRRLDTAEKVLKKEGIPIPKD